jgi:hypothetical protein
MSKSFTLIKNPIDPRLYIVRDNENGFYNISRTAKCIHELDEGDVHQTVPTAKNWLRTKTTQSTIEAIKQKYGIQEPVIKHTTVSNEYKGTYAHPSLHLMFMAWLDPQYSMDIWMLSSELLLAQGEEEWDASAAPVEYCKTCLTGIATVRYKNNCSRCWEREFPKETQYARFRTKEQSFMVPLIAEYPDMALDKRIDGGSSLRRPDGFIDAGGHKIIIEVDENQHKNYDKLCDNVRTMEISQDVRHKPVVFIRINPDEYRSKDGYVDGAFTLTANGVVIKRVAEFDSRLSLLKQTVKDAMATCPDRTITVIKLFFDEL